ncbi:hypothetical protein HAX54_021022, partial [Datura stramonium]|nr:hypothetical protein [Datura stramonium]
LVVNKQRPQSPKHHESRDDSWNQATTRPIWSWQGGLERVEDFSNERRCRAQIVVS